MKCKYLGNSKIRKIIEKFEIKTKNLHKFNSVIPTTPKGSNYQDKQNKLKVQ